jgi:hypothetical protein
MTETGHIPSPGRLEKYIYFKNSYGIYQVTPNKETLIINIIQYNYINYYTLLQSP